MLRLGVLYLFSMPHQWDRRRWRKVPTEFLYIFLSVIFFTYVNALLASFPPSISSFLQQCIVQTESSLFISLLHFVRPFSPDSDTITISVEYTVFHLLTYCLFINRYLILIKRHCTIGLTKIIESKVNETPVADRKSDWMKKIAKTLVGIAEIWTRVLPNAKEVGHPLSCKIQTYKWHYHIISRCWYSLTKWY